VRPFAYTVAIPFNRGLVFISGYKGRPHTQRFHGSFLQARHRAKGLPGGLWFICHLPQGQTVASETQEVKYMRIEEYRQIIGIAANDYIEMARCAEPRALLKVEHDLVTQVTDGHSFSLVEAAQIVDHFSRNVEQDSALWNTEPSIDRALKMQAYYTFQNDVAAEVRSRLQELPREGDTVRADGVVGEVWGVEAVEGGLMLEVFEDSSDDYSILLLDTRVEVVERG
jgi:hypothetical protein